MVIFIICMCIVAVVVVLMIISYVYNRRHKDEKQEGEVTAKKQADIDRRKIRKGIEGEDHVEHMLDQLEEPMRVFRDIVLDASTKLGTTEIDFLVLCSHGVFVLDVKSWDGTYRCDVEKNEAGRDVHVLKKMDAADGTFKNASDQVISRNAGHYSAVKRLITDHASKRLNKWLTGKFHSFVVFRQDNLEGDCDRAVNAKDLMQRIRSYSGNLNEEDVREIAEIIRDHHSKVTREEHVRHLIDTYPIDFESEGGNVQTPEALHS